MAATTTVDVLSAKDARLFVSAVDVNYSAPELKDTIFNKMNDDSFLLVTKSIGSKITISEVKVIDDALIDSFFS